MYRNVQIVACCQLGTLVHVLIPTVWRSFLLLLVMLTQARNVATLDMLFQWATALIIILRVSLLVMHRMRMHEKTALITFHWVRFMSSSALIFRCCSHEASMRHLVKAYMENKQKLHRSTALAWFNTGCPMICELYRWGRIITHSTQSGPVYMCIVC